MAVFETPALANSLALNTIYREVLPVNDPANVDR